MTTGQKQTVGALLTDNISRDLVMAVEDALTVGAERGYLAASGMHEGHLPTVVGQLRHFHMNETFREALEVAAAGPSPIKGNTIVTGQAGVFTLGRFNIPAGLWNNGRRSRTRREMSQANRAVEPLVQPGLFGPILPIHRATAFFVATFSGSLKVHPHGPIGIDIAVPNRDMSGWLFREPLGVFLCRYDQVSSVADLAVPTLKQGVIHLKRDGTQ